MKVKITCTYCNHSKVFDWQPINYMCPTCKDSKNLSAYEYKNIDQYEGAPPFEEKEPEMINREEYDNSEYHF